MKWPFSLLLKLVCLCAFSAQSPTAKPAIPSFFSAPLSFIWTRRAVVCCQFDDDDDGARFLDDEPSRWLLLLLSNSINQLTLSTLLSRKRKWNQQRQSSYRKYQWIARINKTNMLPKSHFLKCVAFCPQPLQKLYILWEMRYKYVVFGTAVEFSIS